MLEKDVEALILDYLEALPEFEAWQVKVQGTYDSKKKTYRMPRSKYKRAGVSDIIAFGLGYAWFIEVKAPGKKKNITEHQRSFLESAFGNNQIALVADCLEDVQRQIDKIRSFPKRAADPNH